LRAPETLMLEIGSDRWLRLAHDGLCLLAAAGLLATRAQAQVIGGWLAALAICWAVSRWQLGRASLRGQMQLRRDGGASLLEAGGSCEMRLLYSWLACGVCVLNLEESASGRHCRAVVCRSRNDSDSWRRLRVRLRTTGSHGEAAW